jgi:riboflavin kinase/FMN adenylyltransferase
MQLIRSLHNLKPYPTKRVVTIGTFDGVHIGHQALIKEAISKAKQLDTQAMVLTFEPHPVEYFSRDKVTVPRLTRFREKVAVLAQYHEGVALFLEFNHQVADKTASEFVMDILVNSIGVQHIIVGEDFRFGAKRTGDVALLTAMGKEHGFTVYAMPAVNLDGERVSSTRVREALVAGNMPLAERLLGRPYSMQGRVRHGNKLGRQLGFPTANIYVHRALSPVNGIYAVMVKGLGDKLLPGAAYVGTRPTVDGVRTLLEVNLLDFNQDIYGAYVDVIFCQKIRDDARFATLDEMKAQIALDVKNTRAYFQQ